MQSRRYTVTVLGRLGERFSTTFPGVLIEPRHGHSRLITEPFDQGQLHGLLNRVRDFGFDLLAVEEIHAVDEGAMPRANLSGGLRVGVIPGVVVPAVSRYFGDGRAPSASAAEGTARAALP